MDDRHPCIGCTMFFNSLYNVDSVIVEKFINPIYIEKINNQFLSYNCRIIQGKLVLKLLVNLSQIEQESNKI